MNFLCIFNELVLFMSLTVYITEEFGNRNIYEEYKYIIS